MTEKKTKRKPGRKRKEGVEREPNGRIRRAKRQQTKTDTDPRATALSARARHSGLTAPHFAGLLKDQKMASWLGRLCLTEKIAEEDYEAAEKFLRLRQAFMRAIAAPGAIYAPAEKDKPKQSDEEYSEWVQKIKTEYSSVLQMLRDLQIQHREQNILPTIQYVFVDDWEKPYLLTEIRLICAALRRHFAI